MTAETSPEPGAQPAAQSPLTVDFKEIVLAALKEWNIPGASIAVVDKDQVFSEGYGFASLPDTPATVDTLWYAGSSTKMQTCATLAQLIDTKKHPALSKGWQTPFGSIIADDFVVQDAWATQNLTLEDAACHRTGFDRHDFAMLGEGEGGKQVTMRDQVRNMRNFAFVHAPRVQHSYSNWPYFALSHVIETLEDKPLGQAMKDVIWDPLGMKSTYADTDDAIAGPEHLSTGYTWNAETDNHKALPQTTVRAAGGAGCMITSVNDMAKWLRCIMDEAEPFSDAVHAELRRPRVISDLTTSKTTGADITTYGLGVQRSLYRGQVWFEHGGTTDGHTTNLIWLPDIKFGVVIMANAAPTGNFMGNILAHRLVDGKLGIAEQDRQDLSTPSHAKWDVISGLKCDTVILTNRPDPPVPSQVDIAGLAGSYRDAGYGTLVLRVEDDAGKDAKPDTKVLFAERSDVWLRYDLTLRHASGNWWTCYMSLQNNKLMTVAFAGEFRIGVDGKPVGLNIEFKNDMLGMDEGSVFFKKVD